MNQYAPPKSDLTPGTTTDIEAAQRGGATLFAAGLIAICVLAGTANFVVPPFRDLLKEFGSDLPLVTQIAIRYYHYLWLLLLVVVGVRFAWPKKRSASLAACFTGVGLLIAGIALLMVAMYLPIFKMGQVI